MRFIVRENTHPASGNQDVTIEDTSGGGLGRVLWGQITSWSAGDPQVTIGSSQGVFLGKQEHDYEYWALDFETDPLIAANTNSCRIYPAKTPAAQGSIDVYRVNAFDTTPPPIGCAGVATAAVTITGPRYMTVAAANGVASIAEILILDIPPE